jgi:hypothetical protein
VDRNVLIEEVYKIIDQANLSEEDKRLWHEFLNKANEDQIAPILGLMQEFDSPEFMLEVTDLFKDRVAILRGEKTAEEVLDKEKAKLLATFVQKYE